MRKACFLDRDGVIVEEVNYLGNPDDVRLVPSATAALKKLEKAGYMRIVITNQAGVAKGYFPESAIADVHTRINELLALEGTSVDAYYYCPHHPEGSVSDYAITCDCRKPGTAMLEQAVKDFEISLAGSVLIGDKMSDLAAGKSVGVEAFLVRTGHGKDHIAAAEARGNRIFADIGKVVSYLIQT